MYKYNLVYKGKRTWQKWDDARPLVWNLRMQRMERMMVTLLGL